MALFIVMFCFVILRYDSASFRFVCAILQLVRFILGIKTLSMKIILKTILLLVHNSFREQISKSTTVSIKEVEGLKLLYNLFFHLLTNHTL